MATPLFTAAFWADVVERAVKTAAQAPLTAFTFSDQGVFNAFDLDWSLVAGFALAGFVVSVLTSLASAPLGGGTASVLPAVATSVAPLPPPPP